MLDPIQNQALRLCLGAFRTTPVESLQVEANEPSLALRKKKLALQYAIKLQSNPSNPAFDCTFNPQYKILFERKTSAIPTFGIRIGHLLLGMNIDLDSIAVYRLPFIPSWTLHTPAINFGLHTGKKFTIDPNTFKLQFCDIINSYPNYTYIYTDGSKEGDSVQQYQEKM